MPHQEHNPDHGRIDARRADTLCAATSAARSTSRAAAEVTCGPLKPIGRATPWLDARLCHAIGVRERRGLA
jgi:hypothetical protein